MCLCLPLSSCVSSQLCLPDSLSLYFYLFPCFYSLNCHLERKEPWKQESSHSHNPQQLLCPMGEGQWKVSPGGFSLSSLSPCCYLSLLDCWLWWAQLAYTASTRLLAADSQRHCHTETRAHWSFFQVSLSAPLFIWCAWSLAFPTQPRVPGVWVVTVVITFANLLFTNALFV